MAQHYSNPNQKNNTYNLPDVETFYHQHAKRERCMLNAGDQASLYGECIVDDEGDCLGTGWYYWFCSPGCLPEGEPIGPYDSESEALDAAREGVE